MKTELMFSSKTDLWATPQDFFDRLYCQPDARAWSQHQPEPYQDLQKGNCMSLEENIAQLSGLVIQLGQRLVQIERRLNAVLEQPMTDKEICEWLKITSNTLRNWRKYKDFPEFATHQNVMDWYGQGHGKGRKAA